MRQMALNLVGTLTTSILLAVACPIGAVARSMDGGTSGGGGAIVFSEAKDIKPALVKMFKPVPPKDAPGMTGDSPLEKALSALDSRRGEVEDPQLKSVFKKMFGRLEFAAVANAVTWVTKYDLQNDPCIDKDGHARAASVKSVNLGKDWPRSSSEFDAGEANQNKFSVKLCYSVSELVKIPRANLDQQLIVLTIHELTHVFGYDEAVAVKVQNYLLESGRHLVNPATDSLDSLQHLVEILDLSTGSVEESLSEKDVRVCMSVGQFLGVLNIIEMQVDDLQIKGEDMGRPLAISKKALKALENINKSANVLEDFCSGEKAGDRAAVKKNVEYIYKMTKILAEQLGMNTMNY